MKRSLRVSVAAVVLLAGVGGLLAAWYISSQRAFDAERSLLAQMAARRTGERERMIASSLAERLETLRRGESDRPYFHYQNLYHDPRGASQGLSVMPSPLASGNEHPLVLGHFQIDAKNEVTLPTLNEKLGELNAPDASRQRALRASIASSAPAVLQSASALRAQVEREASAAEADAKRIAELETKLANAQRAEALRLEREKLALQRGEQQRRRSNQVQMLDPSVFAQNANPNDVYLQLKQNPAAALPPAIPRAAPRIEIVASNLEWRTVPIDGVPRLVALRAVHTPNGTLTQGIVTTLGDGATIDGAQVRRTSGSRIERTDWSVSVPQERIAPAAAPRQRFLRTFAGVSGVLLLVIFGVIWTMWRAETLATDRTRFAATAAHELRTPLASLRLYSDLIAEEEDPAHRERYARELASQTERLGRVVANVLEVTRIERGAFAIHPRRGAIGVAIAECVERLRPQMEAAQCPIHLRIDDALPEIAFDADAIHHVVDNLVDNAEKYSRDVADRSIAIDVAAEDGGVAITVRDRGPGLAEELLREPKAFRRAAADHAPAGLGLGLFLVDRIVRAHHGALRGTNAAGGGASVRVFLPAFYEA